MKMTLRRQLCTAAALSFVSLELGCQGTSAITQNQLAVGQAKYVGINKLALPTVNLPRQAILHGDLLKYDEKIIAQVAHGPTIGDLNFISDAAGRVTISHDGAGFRLLDDSNCPPPLPTIVTGPCGQFQNCTPSTSYYYYSQSGTSYSLYYHIGDGESVCGLPQGCIYGPAEFFVAKYDCGGAQTSPTPTPTPDAEMVVDNAAISPGQQLGQDFTRIHITSAGVWSLTISGGALNSPRLVYSYKGNQTIKWYGNLDDGTPLGNGNYSLSLTDSATGKVLQAPISITALSMTVESGTEGTHAFSPDNDGVKDKLPIKILAAPNLSWQLTADEKPGLVFLTGVDTPESNPIQWSDLPGNSQALNNQKADRVIRDGSYTLRLRPQNASQSVFDPITRITIDTNKPSVTNVKSSVGQNDDVEVTATVTEDQSHDTGSGVSTENIVVVANGINLSSGSKTYNKSTGDFKLTLSPAEFQDAIQNISLTQDPFDNGNEKLTVLATDNAGNQAQGKVTKDREGSKISIIPGEGYHIASLINPGIFRPLIENLRVIVQAPPQPELSVLIFKNLDTKSIAYLLPVAYSPDDTIVNWNGRKLVFQYQPQPDGRYLVERYNMNFVLEDSAAFNISNQRDFELSDGITPQDTQKQSHIVLNKRHKWDSLFPIIINPAPTSLQLASDYHAYIAPLLRSIMSNLANVSADRLIDYPSASPPPNNIVTYDWLTTDLSGNAVTVEVRANRRFTGGRLVEYVGTAFVK